jgi:hypothetical protein
MPGIHQRDRDRTVRLLRGAEDAFGELAELIANKVDLEHPEIVAEAVQEFVKADTALYRVLKVLARLGPKAFVVTRPQ